MEPNTGSHIFHDITYSVQLLKILHQSPSEMKVMKMTGLDMAQSTVDKPTCTHQNCTETDQNRDGIGNSVVVINCRNVGGELYHVGQEQGWEESKVCRS